MTSRLLLERTTFVRQLLAYPYSIFFYIRPKDWFLVFPVGNSIDDRVNHCIYLAAQLPERICVFIVVTLIYLWLVNENQQIPVRPFVRISTSLRTKKNDMPITRYYLLGSFLYIWENCCVHMADIFRKVKLFFWIQQDFFWFILSTCAIKHKKGAAAFWATAPKYLELVNQFWITSPPQNQRPGCCRQSCCC